MPVTAACVCHSMASVHRTGYTLSTEDVQTLNTGNLMAGNKTVYAPADGLQPVYCLFTQPQYEEGDKWRARVGGGDLIRGRKSVA